jgi:hypothetical protein
MLSVQQYLKSGKTLQDLADDFAIRAVIHPELPLVLLNYSQIDSPKTHPIVRECRCLILEIDSWDLVSRSFERFYNWGEVQDEAKLFDWESAYALDKIDGSLVNIFYYRDRWIATTRGSWAQQELTDGFSWEDAFCQAMGLEDLSYLDNYLDRHKSYACEFVSPWNKVVDPYVNPNMFLLTIFEKGKELSRENIEYICENTNISQIFDIPSKYEFAKNKAGEVLKFVEYKSTLRRTWEGVVLCDASGRRWKFKSSTYVALHHLHDNGNIYLTKNLIPIVLAGEIDEILTHFPEIKQRLIAVKEEVDAAYTELEELWIAAKDIDSQKEFAQYILARTKFASILFMARKASVEPKSLWCDNAELIYKVLYDGKAIGG